MNDAARTAIAGQATPRPPRASALPALVIPCALAGLYYWLVFAFAFGHDGLIGPRYNAPGTDYMVYWSVARAALAGDLAPVADADVLTAAINARFAEWLSSPLPLHPWLYPPHFLLFLLPFGALSFPLSFALFQLATFAAAAMAWRVAFAASPSRRPMGLALALAPAAAVNALCGQNGFLTVALLLGGVGLLGRADLAAGALLGLATYKPQFALLVPVALIAARNWRALGAAAATAALAVGASAAIVGIAPWLDWLGRTLAGGGPGDAAWREAGQLWGLSIWACARLLGASDPVAEAAQAAAILVAAGCVWRAFSRPTPDGRRIAALLAATLLAAPHSEPYDLLLLAACVPLLAGGGDRPATPVATAMLMLAWAAPLLSVPRATPMGFAVPLLIAGVLVLAMFPSRDVSGAATALL